jgi:predicted amino acid-binding ACT domain protein
MNQKTTQSSPSELFAVAIMSRDRVGIVRDVTGALKRLNANIERLSQTVVMDYFTLTLVVSIPQPPSVEELRDLLRSAGSPGEFEVSVKQFSKGAKARPVVSDADIFILTMTGLDRPGILAELAAYLAGKGINIVDLYMYKPNPTDFVLISELAVPQQMNADQIQLDIEALGKKSGLAVTIQHQNIFKATNEVTAPANVF